MTFDGSNHKFDIDSFAATTAFVVADESSVSTSINSLFGNVSTESLRTFSRIYRSVASSTSIDFQYLGSIHVNGATTPLASDLLHIVAAVNGNGGQDVDRLASTTTAGREWGGTAGEWVFYGSDKSADRAAIESNIAARYGITLA